MKSKNITSLRKYRAERCFKGYISLPRSQRTSARSALVLEAIFEYAYESVPRHKIMTERQIRVDPDESRRICERLEEFIPGSVDDGSEPIMSWLHDNLVPEAWTYPEDMRNLMKDILQES
ncbi:MAG: hypothetical protein ACN4GT_10885 [Gammaproteobacteria bacterium]